MSAEALYHQMRLEGYRVEKTWRGEEKLPCGFDNSTLNCRECVPVASPPRARKNELLEGLEAEAA